MYFIPLLISLILPKFTPNQNAISCKLSPLRIIPLIREIFVSSNIELDLYVYFLRDMGFFSKYFSLDIFINI